MVIIESIYDRKYNRIGYLSNEAEDGVHYRQDQLTTSIETGMYDFSFMVPKTTPKVNLLQVGNYIETFTHTGKHLLLRIMEVSPETHSELHITCLDTSIYATNSYADPIKEPEQPESLDYYAKHALESTGVELKAIESNRSLKLEFSSDQRVLERLRELATAFELELDFDIEFTPGSMPKRFVSFKEKRVEDYTGFDVSSDDLLVEIDRSQNIYNLATKLKVKGKSFGTETETPTTSTGKAPNTQQATTNFDSSKSSGATAISTTGWNETEVNGFKMNQADPPYVTGDYIDKFLRTYYSDSPLIGQGSTIKELADYFGVSVGAAMGVWAKETTFGRGHPGLVDHNYGCIRHTSDWPAANWGGSAWNKYPNKRTGIAAWMKLVRYVYIEKDRNRYEDFLNVYSPSFENSQATFKNIMWGTLKSFGYDMSDSTAKKNYSSSSDDPRNVTTTTLTTPTETNDGGGDAIAEAAIAEAFRIKKLGLRYQWGGNGNPSYDCSGYMQQCYKAAGLNPSSAGWPRATTHSMWAQDGKFKRISRSELKRGDLIMIDNGYGQQPAPNHVGMYLGPTLDSPNSMIHAGDPVGLTQKANSMTITGYVTVER